MKTKQSTIEPLVHRAAPGTVEYSDNLLRARKEHDCFSFEELQTAYNFRNISDRRRVFTNLIVDHLKSLPNSATVLDIGCGCGMARENSWQWAIRPYAQSYLGIEPDPSVGTAKGLFNQTETATLETADLPDNSVDVAYSWMVMEHVENPLSFCQRLFAALKPGGHYYFSTPNINHYFTITARLMKQLRIDERVLAMVRKKEDLDEYHYPVQYKFNSEAQVRAIARQVGFASPEFAFVEAVGPIKYFPGPAKAIFHGLALKRKLIHNPRVLLTTIGRLTKPFA